MNVKSSRGYGAELSVVVQLGGFDRSSVIEPYGARVDRGPGGWDLAVQGVMNTASVEVKRRGDFDFGDVLEMTTSRRHDRRTVQLAIR